VSETEATRSGGEAVRAGRQVARLRRVLRERDERLYELETRLAALEGSTTYQVGKLVAGAGRKKARGAVRLPKQLYGLWKKRNKAQPSGPLRERPRMEGLDRIEDRLLIADPYEGLIIAGILSAATAAVLADHARVIRLYPHDAALVLDAADVDLVIVDAAAGAPGGPWAYLGVPGVYDRERTLLDVRQVAGVRNLPLVLWGSAPPATLTRLGWDASVVPGSSPADDLTALTEQLAIPWQSLGSVS
jgi:hypothetical protein